MHVCVRSTAPNSAFHASVVIAEEHALPDLGPFGRLGMGGRHSQVSAHTVGEYRSDGAEDANAPAAISHGRHANTSATIKRQTYLGPQFALAILGRVVFRNFPIAHRSSAAPAWHAGAIQVRTAPIRRAREAGRRSLRSSVMDLLEASAVWEAGYHGSADWLGEPTKAVR